MRFFPITKNTFIVSKAETQCKENILIFQTQGAFPCPAAVRLSLKKIFAYSFVATGISICVI